MDSAYEIASYEAQAFWGQWLPALLTLVLAGLTAYFSYRAAITLRDDYRAYRRRTAAAASAAGPSGEHVVRVVAVHRRRRATVGKPSPVRSHKATRPFFDTKGHRRTHRRKVGESRA